MVYPLVEDVALVLNIDELIFGVAVAVFCLLARVFPRSAVFLEAYSFHNFDVHCLCRMVVGVVPYSFGAIWVVELKCLFVAGFPDAAKGWVAVVAFTGLVIRINYPH